MKTTVLSRLQFEGFHNWPAAPADCEYLRERHRHVFHVVTEAVVSHDDRAIEFLSFKRRVEAYVRAAWGSPAELGSLSCEHITRQLVEVYGLVSCEVSEDGENGARVVA